MMCAVPTYVLTNLPIYLPFSIIGVHNSKITFSIYLLITYTTCMVYFIYHFRNLLVLVFYSDSQNSKTRQNKSRKIENIVMSYLQSQRPNCTIESYYTIRTQKKNDRFNVDVFCDPAKLYSKQWFVTFTFVHVNKQGQVCQRKRPR